MTIQVQVPRFIPRDYDVFAGLDVDKKSMSVVFADHQGAMRALRMAYDAEPLLNYVRKHYAGQRVAFAYEAGPTGFGLHDELVRQAYTCVVAAPSKVPRAPGERVKTNRLDSRKAGGEFARRTTARHSRAAPNLSRPASPCATARHARTATDCQQTAH